MKAVTLYQPWAWAMGRFKWNETRSWATSYRGELAIHAGKTVDRDFVADAIEEGYLTTATSLATGAIVAVGWLADCQPTRDAAINPDEHFWGNYEPGRVMWIFKDLRLVTPVICPGHQGLWDVPEIIARELAAQPPLTRSVPKAFLDRQASA